LRGTLKDRPLIGNSALVVGASEVRHKRNRTHLGVVAQCSEHTRQMGGSDSEPIHSGIELDEQVDARAGWQIAQHPHLANIVQRAQEIVRCRHRKLAHIEYTLQQQDRMRVASLAQAHGVVDLEQRKAIGSRKRLRTSQQPMPVGVRLDDGEHARSRRQTPGNA
jgi:hypothetical protein